MQSGCVQVWDSAERGRLAREVVAFSFTTGGTASREDKLKLELQLAEEPPALRLLLDALELNVQS